MTYGMEGDVVEIILYNRALSNAERIQIEQYIRNKYTPSVELGVDIVVPYGFCDTSLVAYKPWYTQYQWSTGGTDSIIQVSKAGIYTVTTTDILGFTSSDQITVTYPLPTITKQDTTICLGTIYTAQAMSTDTASYTYQWNTGDTTNTIHISTAGSYWCTVTDTTRATKSQTENFERFSSKKCL